MRGFSKAIIAGNLTRDPETRSTTSGASVTSFSVAVNRTYRGSDGSNKEDVAYIDCVAWGKTGETIAQYLKKGSGILLSGRISQTSWEDKQSGQKRSRLEIVVEEFNFVGGDTAGQGGASRSNNSTSAADVIPDDVPEDDNISLDEVPF